MLQTDTTVGRVKASGVQSASPIDLVAIGFSRREQDAVEGERCARDILQRCVKIAHLPDLSPAEINEVSGLETFEILRVQALIELGRRSALAKDGEFTVTDCPEDVAQLLSHLRNEKREHFCVIMLDAQNQIIRWTTIHIGTLTMSVVGPREVFREAVRDGACSIIVAHNHPSGDPTASPEDIEVTRKLAEIGKLLDIPLLDHIIIVFGSRKPVSLRALGIIK